MKRKLNHKSYLVLLLAALGLLSCVKKSGPKETLPKTVQNSIDNSIEKKPLQTPLDLRIKNLTQVFSQADQIHREVLWVLLKDRPARGKSFFGKSMRALVDHQGIKLSGKSFFRCDQYELSVQSESLKALPLNISFFESCQKNRPARKFAQLEMTSAQKFKVSFFSENLEEVLGMASSILNKNFNCSFDLENETVISKLSCDLVLHDKSTDEMFEFKKYIYTQSISTNRISTHSKENLILIEGHLLRNLLPQRQVKLRVPLEGKIKLTEIEMHPQEAFPQPAVVAEAETKKAEPPPEDVDWRKLPPRTDSGDFSQAKKKTLLDPDIKGLRSGGRGGAVTAKPIINENEPMVDDQGYPLTPDQIQAIQDEQNNQNPIQGNEDHGENSQQENGQQVEGSGQIQSSKAAGEDGENGNEDGDEESDYDESTGPESEIPHQAAPPVQDPGPSSR